MQLVFDSKAVQMQSQQKRVHIRAKYQVPPLLLLPLLLVVAWTTAEYQSGSISLYRRQSFEYVSQVAHHGAYGAAASANLSDFKSGLLSTMLDAFDTTKPQGQGFKRWEVLKPVISCPPDEPLTRYGNSEDGGKLLCDVSKLPSSCIIYSLGSFGDYSFEMDMLNVTRCEIHTFDCTYDGKSQHPTRHFYHKWCVGASNEPSYKNWQEITAALGHSHRNLDILKFDIEGFETSVMAELRHDRPLPRQIVTEVHMGNPGSAPKTLPHLGLMMMHMASLGYGIVGKEDNIWATPAGCCAEWTFLLVEKQLRGPNARLANHPRRM